MTEAGVGGMGGGGYMNHVVHRTPQEKKLCYSSHDVLSRDGGIITPAATKQVNFDTGRPVAVATVPEGISLPPPNSLTAIRLTAPNRVSSALLEL